jgi:uncharacterized protein (DUF488 family)
MEIYTIGYTKTTAAGFFGKLKQAGVQRIIDVRLNNSSQLAGFAKRDDLRFFLAEICGAEYMHQPLLAPTQQILDAYKKENGSWEQYERQFLQLLADRRVETVLSPDLFDAPTALLCSEPTAEHCHRRLVLEYLHDRWGDVQAIHL